MRKLLIIGLFFTGHTWAQEPPRKAIVGWIGKATERGLQTDSIVPGGTFDVMKVQKGDIILSLNNTSTTTLESYQKIASSLRTGNAVNITVLRKGRELKLTGKAIMRPYEQLDYADVLYDWVPFRNGFLRTITRKPKGKTNLPAILLIPGYGCGSIETYMNSYNGKLLSEWVKAGYAVVTIEKSGLGDSYQCEPCGEVDLVTDIQSFDAGYRFMENLPFVDKTNLYVWGHSMGGVIAPEVAKLHQPKGVMVFGATFRPWSEFLLEMHRIQKPLLENQTYLQTETFIRQIQKIYYEFFVMKKSPTQLHAIPEYTALVESELTYKPGSNDMWGRHWRYWQQLDSLNLAATWQSLSCPVLIIHGETDYEQCSKVEPLLMQQSVNASHPGNATVKYIPELDHFMMKSATWEEARDHFKAQQYNKGNFNQQIAVETINWLRQH